MRTDKYVNKNKTKACSFYQRTRKEAIKQERKLLDNDILFQPNATENTVAPPPSMLADVSRCKVGSLDLHPRTVVMRHPIVSVCGEWKFIFEPESRPVVVVKSGAQKETKGREAALPRTLWGFVSAPRLLLHIPTPVLLIG